MVYVWFFSGSSSKKRYPNGNRGGSYYQRGGGIFGKFGSFSDRAVADVSITMDTGSRGILRRQLSAGISSGNNYQQNYPQQSSPQQRFRKILRVPPFARSAAVQYLPDQSFAFPAAPRLRAQHFAQDAEGLCRPAQSSVRNAVHRANR